MAKSLLVYPEKCLGCGICESFCSLSHTNTCNPSRSRISIVKMNQDVYCIPMLCLQCTDAACEKTCPTGAIHRSRTTGALETNLELCIGCRMCVSACPFGSMGVDPWEGTVFCCDLCQGEPLCAEVCPFGAITYLEEERQALHKKRDGAKKYLEALDKFTGKSPGE